MEKIIRAHWLNAVIVLGLIAVSLFINDQYNPAQRRLRADPSIMMYVGQQMLRGNAPYTTVTIVKTPVTGMLVAGALLAGRAVHLDDILAARGAFMLLAALLIAVTFLLGGALWSRWAGLFAALTLLGMDVLHQRAADGPSPKIPFILFGMAALWLAAKRWWLVAGILAALSFLTWQPGLVFVAAVVVGAFLNVKEARWKARLKAIGMTLVGAVIPLVLVGGYLGWKGALGEGLKQTFGANASYFGADKVGAGLTNVLRGNVVNLIAETPRCFTGEELFVPLGIIGVLGILGYGLWAARRGNRTALYQTLPMLFSVGVLFGFTLIDFQSCADELPFFPYLALGTGWLVWFAWRAISTRLAKRAETTESAAQSSSKRPAWHKYAIGGLLALVILGYGLSDELSDRRGAGLQQQRRMAANMEKRLGATGQLQQFGDAVLLVILQRQNATRFIHLGNKQGAGILRAENIDPADLPNLLAAQPPRVITLSRAKNQPWAKALYAWIDAHYTLAQSYDAADGGTPQKTDVYVAK